MKTIAAMLIICLFFASPAMACDCVQAVVVSPVQYVQAVQVQKVQVQKVQVQKVQVQKVQVQKVQVRKVQRVQVRVRGH